MMTGRDETGVRFSFVPEESGTHVILDHTGGNVHLEGQRETLIEHARVRLVKDNAPATELRRRPGLRYSNHSGRAKTGLETE